MKETTVKPIVLTNKETNTQYTLEFSRESVKYAERHGFVLDDIDKFPMTKMEELFCYSFRMHHPNITPQKALSILYDDLGGMPSGLSVRLAELYALPFKSMTQDDGAKNSKMTVEMD